MGPVFPPLLLDRLAAPAAVLGAGVSGRGAAELLARLDASAVIYDQRGGTAQAHFGPGEAARHRLVVFSPGFTPDHPWLEAARAEGALCLGEVDLAALCWPGRVIGITGTNGKTTLTEFLAHALVRAGQPAFAVGNIGFPFTRLAAQDTPAGAIAVCEISSFQAETLRHLRAEASLWTNLAEDHLERHRDMGAYFEAKARLVAHTAPGGAFVGTSVAAWAARLGRSLGGVRIVASEGLPPDARLAGTVFAEYPQRENFALAEAWWHTTGLGLDALLGAAHTFSLGRHRLARCAQGAGVSWWNDSKGTNFHAVLAAVARLPGPVRWIGGGKSKGGDVAAFVAALAPRVRHAYLIGETAPALAAACVAAGLPHTVAGTLDCACAAAARDARPGDHVLLSPGFSSFDQFRDYADRGEQFERLAALHAAPVAASAS